jgi:hypothetical protein
MKKNEYALPAVDEPGTPSHPVTVNGFGRCDVKECSVFVCFGYLALALSHKNATHAKKKKKKKKKCLPVPCCTLR